MNPRIRQATVADAETILRHRERMFADMGEGSNEARRAMIDAARPFVEAALADGSYRGWLAEWDGSVIAGGGVAVVPFQPTPLDPAARRAWILNVYTEPGFRRRGVARQIMERIITWCRGQGFAVVMLHASDDGRPLYEQLRFVPTNEMKLLLR